MKRLTALLIIPLLLLTACGKNTVNIPDRPEAPATVEAPSSNAIALSPEGSSSAPPAEETDTAGSASASVAQTTAETSSSAKETVTQATTVRSAESEAPATTEPAAPTAHQPEQNTCTVRIECGTIYDNLQKLKAGKAAFVPKSGVILEDTAVTLQEGDTAFTVLKRACGEHVCTDNCRYCQAEGIQIEYNFTPVFETYYIEGIHQIYEKDCGAMSGWMFSVNGSFPEEGASSTAVSAGDRIVFCYTCDMGNDVGNHFEG